MKYAVFCLFVEVAPFEGCELDPSEVAGAALRCYVLAPDADEAERKTRAALEADRFEVVEVEWCVAVDEVEWENPDDEDGAVFENAARLNPEDVVYGEFHTWSPDADDA